MEIKERISEWFDGPRDYSLGLELLKEVSKKARVMGKLSKGESKTRREKLEYELKHFMGLKIIMPAASVVSAKKTVIISDKGPSGGGSASTGPRFSLIPKGKSADDYPEDVKRVIIENSTLYMQRGKLHKKLTDLGDENTPEIVASRAELTAKISDTSVRLEELFKAFSEYEISGKLPEGFTPVEKKGAITELSVEELKKEKKNLQASLAKDRNLLEFQSKTKPEGGASKPMPAGPKRIKLEKRISAKIAQIEAIDMQIAQKE